MENQLLSLMNPIQMALAATSMLLLIGFVFARYYKAGFLRESPRLRVISPAEQRRILRMESHSVLELEDISGQRDAAAQLMNISLSGLCFVSPLQLKNGEPVQVKLRSCKDWLLHLSGRVVWVKPEPLLTTYGFEIQTVSENRL